MINKANLNLDLFLKAYLIGDKVNSKLSKAPKTNIHG
jgi:hypothetical protein